MALLLKMVALGKVSLLPQKWEEERAGGSPGLQLRAGGEEGGMGRWVGGGRLAYGALF